MISDPALAPRRTRGRISGLYRELRDWWAEDLMDPYLVLAWCFLVFVALLVIGLPSLWWLKSHDVARREKAAPPKVSS